MSDANSAAARASRTALLVVVDEVEPVVDCWRQRFDSSAAAGVPAHVTVLFPFLDMDRVDAALVSELRATFDEHSSFDIRFEQCRRFVDALYLAPVPDQPFRALTEAAMARWPEVPPYGGRFAEVIPHLTVANDRPSEVYDEVEAAVAAQLPVSAHISSVKLFMRDGELWQARAEFPLRP